MARIRGTNGNDTRNGTQFADEIDGLAGNDQLYGLGGNDEIDGDAGNDRLFGGDGHDELQGDGGSDRLFGGAGNDDLDGDNGNDILFGGKGNDTIDGGAGDDRLSGGAGSDVFEFDFGDGRDVITDFTNGQDRIHLDDMSRSQVNAVINGAEQSGDNIVLTLSAGNVITINNMQLSQLTEADFLFWSRNYPVFTQSARKAQAALADCAWRYLQPVWRCCRGTGSGGGKNQLGFLPCATVVGLCHDAVTGCSRRSAGLSSS